MMTIISATLLIAAVILAVLAYAAGGLVMEHKAEGRDVGGLVGIGLLFAIAATVLAFTAGALS